MLTNDEKREAIGRHLDYAEVQIVETLGLNNPDDPKPIKNIAQDIAQKMLSRYQPGSALDGATVSIPVVPDAEMAVISQKIKAAQNQQEIAAVILDHAETLVKIGLKVALL